MKFVACMHVLRGDGKQMLLLHEQLRTSQESKGALVVLQRDLQKKLCPGSKLQAAELNRGATVHKDVSIHVSRANINAENNTKHFSTSKMTLRRPAKNVAASA